MNFTRKLAVLPLIVLVLFAGLIACGHRSRYVTVACAAEVTEYAGPSGSSGGRSSGSSAGRSSSPAKSSPAKAPTGQNKPSVKNANAKPPSEQHAEALKNQAATRPPGAQNSSKSKITPPGEKSYKPPRADVRPPAKDYDRAAVAAPERVTRGGSYRSPVTHHVYVWHDPIYYSSPGYLPDLFDPYNQWNYTNPLSPFFGRPYNLVDAC